MLLQTRRETNGSAEKIVQTTQLTCTSKTRRMVVMWRSSSASDGSGPVVVIAPAFCRQMRHLVALAYSLSMNGAIVYRFDPLDHIGLSDGQHRDFTLTGALESLSAVVDFACSSEQRRSLVVVGVSLLSRVVTRAAALDRRLSRLIHVSGVVDIRSTIARATQCDFLGMEREMLPNTAQFERYTIAPPFYDDAYHEGWTGVESAAADLFRVSQPVVAFQPTADEWVDLSLVRELFQSRENSGPRYLLELPYGEHSLERNPVGLQTLMKHVTHAALADDLDSNDNFTVNLPGFDDIVAASLRERQFHRDSRKEMQTNASRVYQSAVGA
jgi:hypothetical protein